MSYANLSSVSQNVLKFYQQLTGEERYANLSSVSQNVLKFYQQFTGEERRVPFIFGRNNQ